MTATLPNSFASTANGVLAFFGQDSTGTLFPGASPQELRLSFVTIVGGSAAMVLASFYTTGNLSASTCTSNAGGGTQYGGAVFEIVLDNPVGVTSTSTAQLWALPFTVAPFEAVA